MTDQSDYTATAKAIDLPSNDASLPYARSGQSSARMDERERPTHYKVICISMYTKDLKRLDDMVDALKAKGMTKANRSALIRYALSSVDLDHVPQGI